MSIGRLFNEFRPLIRMLEEPITRPSAFYGPRSQQHILNGLFDDSVFGRFTAQPAVDLKDSGNTFVIEADLPGVNKKDIDVQVGEGGRTLTIRGSIKRSSEAEGSEAEAPALVQNGDTSAQPAESHVIEKTQLQMLSSERSFVENTTFTRTIWFPQPVDANQIKAQLKDGVLTVNAGKLAQEDGVKKITVE